MLKTSLSLVPSSIPALLKSATFILGVGSKTQPSKALSSLVWSRWEVGPESSQDYLPAKSSMMLWELCWAPEMTVETILPVVGAELAGCHEHKVPVSAFPSALLLFSLAAWFGGKVKKKPYEVTAKASCLMYGCPPMDRHSPGQGNVGWFFSTGLHLPSVPSYWSIKGW